MDIFLAILQVIIIIGLPLLLLKFRNKKPIKTIGTVGAAYLCGIVIALIMFGINKAGANVSFNADIGEIGSHAAIGVAIPLLLFGTDFVALKRLSKRSLGSFGLLTVSVIVVSVCACFAFASVLDDSGKLAGMATGLYTGGTPNLNAIGSILGVAQEIIAVSNLSDMLIGGIFYVFLLTLCKPLLSKILKAEKPAVYMTGDEEVENIDDFGEIPDKKKLIIAVLIAVGMAAVGAGIGVLIWVLTGSVQGKLNDYLVPAVMVTATVLGLVASFNKKLRKIKGTSLTGHYLILVFSVALSMSMDFNDFNLDYVYIFLLFTTITLGTFILHVILCKIFRIDADCCMITLTAGVYGPAFIPAVAKQAGDEKLIPVGLLCGSLGYAIGTLLGAGLGFILP